jgi:hypothetical protein
MVDIPAGLHVISRMPMRLPGSVTRHKSTRNPE